MPNIQSDLSTGDILITDIVPTHHFPQERSQERLFLGKIWLVPCFREVSTVMGLPNSWLVYFVENPLQMDDDWGCLYFRKPLYVENMSHL